MVNWYNGAIDTMNMNRFLVTSDFYVSIYIKFLAKSFSPSYVFHRYASVNFNQNQTEKVTTGTDQKDSFGEKNS